jgi:3-mercaptopyruvate sulfurtransferase SseA
MSFKSDAEITEVFRGFDQKKIITSCATGKTATILNAALELIGRESVLYDGSYVDYMEKL